MDSRPDALKKNRYTELKGEKGPKGAPFQFKQIRTMREHINVLAIDGGGMYGVVPAEVLIQFQGLLDGNLAEHFDLMVGTSTGSILTGGLAIGMDAVDMQKLYLEKADDIFGKPRAWHYDRPKYKSKYLKRVIGEYFGDSTMSDLDVKYAASAYNVSRNATHFFRSWVDGDIPMTDVIVASSSAPTYHPMHGVDGDCYTDGGLFAPNPAREAFTLALEQFPGKEIRVFSLGTGTKVDTDRECTNKKRNEGMYWWANRLPGMFLDGMDEVTHASMEAMHEAGILQYHRFDTVLFSKRSDETRIEKLEEAIEAMRATLAENPAYLNRAIKAIKG